MALNIAANRLRPPGIRWNCGLTYRLVLYIVAVAAVPVVLIAGFAFRAGSEGIQRHTRFHLTSVAMLKAQEVERWFRPLEASAHTLAQSVPVREQIKSLMAAPPGYQDQAAREGLLSYFQNTLRQNIGLEGVAVVSRDRGVVLAATASGEPFRLPDYKAGRAGEPGVPAYLPPYIPERGTQPVVIDVPVIEDGRVLACIVVLASSVSMYEMLAPDAGLGPQGKVYLVNEAGDVLTPTPQHNARARSIQVPGLINASSGLQSSGLRYRDFQGVQVVGAYQPLEPLGWGVAVELPTKEAFKDIDQMRWAIVAAAASFILLVVLASLLVTRHVTRPLNVLMAGAQAIGRGQLRHRIDINGADEIGMLGRTFNQMAQDLEEAQTRMIEAERAERERTEEAERLRSRELEALFNIAGIMARPGSFEERATRILEELAQIAQAERVILRVPDEKTQGLRLVAAVGWEVPVVWHRTVVPYDDGVLGAVFQNGQLFVSNDYVSSKGASPEAVAQGLRSVVFMPVKAGGRVLGMFSVLSKEPNHFTPEHVRLLTAIGDGLGVLIENAWLASERESQIEERRLLEQQLAQSQKMESIGRLAGGVAHDFNNLLTPIMGYAQLGLMALPDAARTGGYLQEIQKVAERASNLTRQLLTFSRRQVIEPKGINLNELIANMDNMLRRLLVGEIALVTSPAPDLGLVKGDPGQIEQVLMNLVVNGRDAMPHGGRITIETANVTLSESHARQHADASPGPHVMLSVADNGSGMSEEVKAHIFEPFFTTKEAGKGTGLGLATCYGIIRQSGGHIEVYSKAGEGTTFKVYLPRAQGEVEATSQGQELDDLPRGTEMVLLAEDEPSVRGLAASVLRGQGYTVLEASNGVEALSLARTHADGIHLVLTDMMMPQMGGKKLVDELQATRPDIKVIFTSGYADTDTIQHSILEEGREFIQKPFSPAELAQKVRQVLDCPDTGGPTEQARYARVV